MFCFEKKKKRRPVRQIEQMIPKRSEIRAVVYFHWKHVDRQFGTMFCSEPCPLWFKKWNRTGDQRQCLRAPALPQASVWLSWGGRNWLVRQQGSHFSRHLSSADISGGKAEVWASTVRDDGSGAMWFSELLPNAFELGFQVSCPKCSTFLCVFSV